MYPEASTLKGTIYTFFIDAALRLREKKSPGGMIRPGRAVHN